MKMHFAISSLNSSFFTAVSVCLKGITPLVMIPDRTRISSGLGSGEKSEVLKESTFISEPKKKRDSAAGETLG